MNMELKKRMEQMLQNCKKVENNYECSKCRDFGYTFVEVNGCDMAVPCECKDRKEALEKLEKCGISDVFKKKTFKTYNTEKRYQLDAKTKAMKFCQDFKNTNASLLLCGQPGSGKTHLGIAAMLNLIDKNIGVKYEEYTSMIMNLKQAVIDEENYIREESKYTSPRVLFLDDFLKGKTTDADLKYIYKVINTRYLQQKPIILSTELSIQEIISWDEAVGSRLVEMSQGNIITFGSNSDNYRLRNII